jgi:hypothetical protein
MATYQYVTRFLKYETRPLTVSPWVSFQESVVNDAEILSINHFPLDTEVDDGGMWYLYRKDRHVVVANHPGTGNSKFRGQFTAAQQSGYAAPAKISDSEMRSRGTTAISRSIPTNPYVNLATSVAEQVGSPLPSPIGSSLWREKTKSAKNAGSEYLNVEFGWLPLISDIQKAMEAVSKSGELLRNFQKGSGQKTRVGYHYKPIISTAHSSGNVAITPWPPAVDRNGVGSWSRITTENTWFKGCFKYYVPSGDSLSEKIQRYEAYANHLLGIRLTPEVLWNAAPWSWFGDWFGNFGDVMKNISLLGHDGLVMQYGYIMNHRQVMYDVGGWWSFPTVPGKAYYASQRIVELYKRRNAATPYGFGVDLHALSTRQTAILIALGLSKGLPGYPALGT